MQAAAELQPQNVRRSLVESGSLKAEDLLARHELPPRGTTAHRLLAITYAGAFEFHVGRQVSWVDPSRLLFVEPDQAYVDHHVVPGVGHRSIILTPACQTIDELWGDPDAQFARRVHACSLRLQMIVHLLRRATSPLAAEELAIAALAESVAEPRRVMAVDPGCVRRAKAMLHDCADERLTLSEVASELGVTPIHLTQTFKRAEGIPLYRYQTVLRLTRALDLLPKTRNITELALDLGFSSHSHFSAAFRAHFGMTPSHYRSTACSGAPPS